ncbi:hypothetical protein Clacol_002454 [Clathrus columnatus]|uniref:Uncharacterized protein n=1 Tax=Clathrus columnatus TaxID=1419009 RepID=A0AAV5A8M0_9AGAM|nr:hypothetical protein Clacol_002454 [Clathrus columnatus]
MSVFFLNLPKKKTLHSDDYVQVIDAKTPQAVIGVEAEDARVDSRMIKDERIQQDPVRSIYNVDFSDRIG